MNYEKRNWRSENTWSNMNLNLQSQHREKANYQMGFIGKISLKIKQHINIGNHLQCVKYKTVANNHNNKGPEMKKTLLSYQKDNNHSEKGPQVAIMRKVITIMRKVQKLKKKKKNTIMRITVMKKVHIWKKLKTAGAFIKKKKTQI